MSRFSWSYSMYSSAVSCLQCFKRSYIDGIRSGQDSADLAFGSAMHSAFNSIWSGEDGEQTFQIFWGSYEGKDLTYTRFKYPELAQLGMKFCKRFKEKYAERFVLHKAEERLYGKFNDVKLEGQFDYYGLVDGKLTLLDLKTSGYNYPEDKKAVALQLNLYAWLCVENGLPKPEQLCYLVLNKGQGTIQTPMVWEFDHTRAKEMLTEMTTYCKLFEGQDTWPRNPNCLRHNHDCYGGEHAAEQI